MIHKKTSIQELTKKEILRAAQTILKEEGADALSMRRIASRISYSPPMIYGFFSGKDDLVGALSATGFSILTKMMSDAVITTGTVSMQLQQAWLAYWDFAFSEKKLYQLMFGLGTACGTQAGLQITDGPLEITRTILRQIPAVSQAGESRIDQISYTIWSLVHGLIAVCMFKHHLCFDQGLRIIRETIDGLHFP